MLKTRENKNHINPTVISFKLIIFTSIASSFAEGCGNGKKTIRTTKLINIEFKQEMSFISKYLSNFVKIMQCFQYENNISLHCQYYE